jgi:hypothetical protein
MNKSKLLFVTLVILFIIILGFLLFPKQRTDMSADTLDNTLASSNLQAKQLNGVEILETLDLNKSTPQFKLNIQAHSVLPSTPTRLVLIDKFTNKPLIDLPLSVSQYPTECAVHNEMSGKMVKWETSWFSVPNLADSVDNTYKSKLADLYTVQIIYTDASSNAFSSISTIKGVCYQVSKVVPTKPDPQEDSLKEE